MKRDLSAEERVVVELLRKVYPAGAASKEVSSPRIRPERFAGPVGMDDAGHLYPVHGDGKAAAGPGIDRERAAGALFGLAVGDALGTTLEFTQPPAPPFPALARGPHREMTGGGPFALAPGQVTDDTHMACCLAASLRELGRHDARDVARRYVAWLPHTFDVGVQTRASLQALERLPAGADPDEAGRAVWSAGGRSAAGNGSLMRTAPIGVFFASREELRRAASMEDSAVTHFDPRCQIACAALSAMIAIAMARPAASFPRVQLLDVAREEIRLAAAELRVRFGDLTAEIDAGERALRSDVDAAAADDPGLYRPELHLHQHAGFVRVALRLALWEFVHAPSFEAGLVDVVNRGGDADTNGAITGALLGAYHGQAAIPQRWRDTVMGALADQPGPLRDLYHPRQLFTLTDAVE